jgi:uncharacterized protein
MLKTLHEDKRLQPVLGLLMGICFGFFLQKGQVTKYDYIIAQLAMQDFTVIKVMMSAVVTGMIGVYALVSLGLAELHPKPGSLGSTAIGGLIFGIGFGLLGYCPGTALGAVGQGSMDALFGGVLGMLLGASIYAAIYPMLDRTILQKGDFGKMTFPELLEMNRWKVIFYLAGGIVVFFLLLELIGL